LHIFRHGNAQNLVAANRGIILRAGISARDEYIPDGIHVDQAMEAESWLGLHQNNVSPAQASLGGRHHVNHLAIANRGRHAGSAGLEADANSSLQTVQAEGLELSRLRAIFDRSISAPMISHGG
jgi:hypothetical protein